MFCKVLGVRGLCTASLLPFAFFPRGLLSQVGSTDVGSWGQVLKGECGT